MQIDQKILFNIIKNDDCAELQKYDPNSIRNFRFSSNLPDNDPCLNDDPPIICVAAFYGSCKCLNYLIKCNSSLFDIDKKSRSVQYFGIAGGNLDIIKILTQSNLKFFEYLHLAASLDNLSILQFMVNDLHCDPTQVDGLGSTLFHSAAIGNSVKTAKWLINSKFIDPNSQDNHIL